MMRKRATRRLSTSPFPVACSPAEKTPRSTIINKKKRTVGSTSPSAFFDLKASPQINNVDDRHKSLTTMSDLKELAHSSLDNIERNLVDRSHSEILKELETSHSRLHKRFKVQTQACQQVMGDSERENKKLLEWMTENQEAMKSSYTEFVEEAQAATRVCKKSIEELSKSINKRLEDLRGRFGISTS